MVFKKKKSLISQKEHEASASTAVSVKQSETDWISNAVQVVELIGAVGSFTPFPYLKGAAETFKVLLKPIQQMKQNRDNYKTLTMKVTNILRLLLEETEKDYEAASDSFNSFEKGCEEFYRCLRDISNDLESFNKPSKLKPLRRYFAADREKDSLARYQNQIDECRINLMLRGVIRLQTSNNADEMDSGFEKVRLGDLNVLKSSSNGQVEHWEVRWKQESQTRMVRVYKGRDAISKFKKEKEWYSRYRHPNVMQLFGIITSKESPGLVFHNPWCISNEEYRHGFKDLLHLCVDDYRLGASYSEGLHYLAANISHHAYLSWQNPSFSFTFVGFKDREDGYLGRYYVDLSEGYGVIAFDWSPKILQDVPTYQWQSTAIDNKPHELAKIIKTLDSPEMSNALPDPLSLWNLYGAIRINVWQDVSAPAYSVYIGDILLADKHDDRLGASNADLLGFVPCKETSSWDWTVRDEKLHTYFKTANRLAVDDCGECFRIRVPVDRAGAPITEDLQTVVIEYDILYSDRTTWERLTRAFVSQVGYLYARIDGMQIFNRVCTVTGFSWHLQIPKRLECPTEAFEHNELYFFISKPSVHDETLDTYWSLDPSGSERLARSNTDTFGFDPGSFSIQIHRTLRAVYVHRYDFELLWNGHAVSNIDPESNKAARMLGLPLIQLTRSCDVSDIFEDIVLIGEDEAESVDVPENISPDIQTYPTTKYFYSDSITDKTCASE